MIQTMKFVVMNEVNSMADNELFGNSEQLEASYKKDHVADPGKMVEDLVDRQAAIDVIEAGRLTKLIDAETAVNGLKALPPAQPDIVVCGDCIHWICHDRLCGYWNHGVKPLDWCCHADRRTDE